MKLFPMPFSQYWLLLLVPLLLPVYFLIVNPQAFRQPHDKVVIREPGHRLLGPPQDVVPTTNKHLDFARLSQLAYDESMPVEKRDPKDRFADADSAVETAGWKLWPDFPTSELHAKFAISHLRVKVWGNSERKAVAVAFGGTVFTSGKDWKSNLRWFTFKHNDEYTQLVELFVPAFINKFHKLSNEDGWRYLPNATFYATGHSLGGGLAQELAYALTVDSTVPRFTQLYVFDPSPVTGYFSVNSDTRDSNKRTLAIDRIYERGEILALPRALVSLILPPSEDNPRIWQYRYNLFSRSPITGHSIDELASGLADAAAGKLSDSNPR